MQAHRAVLETDHEGHIKDPPTLPPDAKVEAIFLVLDEPASRTSLRKPPPDLSGMRIVGDIVAPALDEQDWNLNRA